MTAEEPTDFRKQPLGDRRYIQVSNFPEDTTVDSTPTSFDSDDSPDGDVYVPVGDSGVFQPTPGKELLFVTPVGAESASTPAAPAGSTNPSDLAPEGRALRDVVLPDGQVVRIVIYTPDSDQPINLDTPTQVFERVDPAGDEVPINREGPLSVISIDYPPQPRPFKACEKATTATTVAPPTSGPGVTTAGPGVTTAGPGPTETGCPQEMTPQVPEGAEKVPGERPGEFVQKTDFGPGVYVEDVPEDEDEPNTRVYKSVEPDNNDRFTPKAGQPILVTVKPGETPAAPTDGSRTPADVVANEPSTLVARLPTPDGGVLEVYEVTPQDETPIAVTDPEDVLEPVTPGDDGDFPVNEDGPTTVIVVDGSDEPREILSCEKLTTAVATPAPTTAATTAGPPSVTTATAAPPPGATTPTPQVTTAAPSPPTTPKVCAEGEVKTLGAGDFTPSTEGMTQTSGPNEFTAPADQKLRAVLTPTDSGVTLQSASLVLSNVESLKVLYYFSDATTGEQPTEEVLAVPASGSVNVYLNSDRPVNRVVIVAEGPDNNQDPTTITVQELTGCAKPATTVASTTAPQPTTPAEEACRDVTEADSFLVSQDSVTVSAQNQASQPTVQDFAITYAANAGSSITLKLYLPADGELQAVQLAGDFVDARIELKQEDTALPQIVNPSNGDNKLTPGERAEFENTKFVAGDIEIRINIESGKAGTVTVEEFRVCTVPRSELCLINTAEVEEALGFKPADGLVGKTEDGEVVDLSTVTYISANVTITGYCYVCECKGNDLLECKKESCETCPDFSEWSECEAGCGEQGKRTRSVSAVGFPDTCPSGTEEQPCTGLCTTTPAQCLTPWSDWSLCEGCTQKRTRTCDSTSPVCAGQCNKSLEETRACGQCTTTPATTPTSTIQCAENEELNTCSTSQSRCEKSCMAYRTGANTCAEDDLPCVPACECKDGFYRNTENNCVPKEQCQCYPPGSNSSVPIGFTSNPEKCTKCMCVDEGYECTKEAGCCELGEWTPWSECSVSCGNGTKTRTRKNNGECGIPETETETIVCNTPCECEDGTEWVKDCEKCKCINGFSTCAPFCEEVNEQTCDNKTSVIITDPEQPCCKKCVEVKKPCRPVKEDTVRLNFTDPISNGLCVSAPIDIQRCEGSCPDSFMTTRYVVSQRSFQLVRDSGSCSCCRPAIVEKAVEFTCGANNDRKTVLVPQISGCNCEACASGGTPEALNAFGER